MLKNILEKKYRGRMRFLAAPNISLDANNWQAACFEFKSFVRDNTQYQLVDNLIYWHCNTELSQCFLMIPVLGPPVELNHQAVLYDIEKGPYWIARLDPSISLLEMGFEPVKAQVISVLKTILPEMGKNFHLVMDDKKIELHFFLQKDYIG